MQRLQRLNRKLQEEVRRLQDTMGTSMVDRREMEAQLRRVEEEVRGREGGREGGRRGEGVS